MAKSKSILSIQGTFQNITHVDSRSYGEHIRAARGTYKPAVLNDALKAEGQKLSHAVVPAKLIKDALEPYRHDFYGGQMWQRLVSLFKRQLKTKGHFDFQELTNFEIYKEYPLSRFTHVNVKTLYHQDTSLLAVTLSYEAPVFKKVNFLDAYRFRVVGIFPMDNVGVTEAQSSEMIDRKATPNDIELNLQVPKQASTVILCVKFEGCEKGEVASGRTTKGMAIVKVVDLVEG